MATMLNITGTATSDDTNYRYKMPKLAAKIEGRGNGIKTVIINMSDIADALNRPPNLPTKFFGCELGAQSRWEDDASKSVVNGAHTAADLQKLLNVFIDKFVLCPSCHLPETALAVKKGLIYHKCSACGAKSPVDMSHKLCTFILKEATAAAAAAAAAAAEATGGSASGSGKKGGKSSKKGTREEKGAAPSPVKKSSSTGTGGAGSTAIPVAAGGAGVVADDDDDDDDVDGGVEGATASKSDGGDGSKASRAKAAVAEEAAEEEDAAAAMAESTVVESLAGALKAGATTDALVADVRKYQINTGRPITDGPALLLHAMFKAAAAPVPTVITSADAARRYAALQALVTACGKEAQQRIAQGVLLHHLSSIIASHADTLLKATPLMLKALYDGEVLEEEVLVDWYKGDAGDGTVKAKAKPFIDWLAAAEEDGDDDEDEDE